MINATTDEENIPVKSKISGKSNSIAILAHGIPSSHHEWDALSSSLVSNGFCTIALDLLGHGDSFKPVDRQFYTADKSYAYFQEWIKSLHLESAFVLIGHSFGGHLSIQYAMDNPADVHALILINPFLSFKQMTGFQHFFFSIPSLATLLLRILPLSLIKMIVWLGSLTIIDQRIRSSLSQNSLSRMAADYKKCSPNIANIPRTVSDDLIDYSKLNIPVLIIWGKRDITLSTAWYEELVHVLPDCTFHRINADHYPHRSNENEVNSLILDFLKNNMRQG